MQGIKTAAEEDTHKPGIVDTFVQPAVPRGPKERRMGADPAIKGGLGGVLAGGLGGGALADKLTLKEHSPTTGDRIVSGVGGAMIGGSLGALGGGLKGKHNILQKRYENDEPLETEEETDKLQERDIIGARGGGGGGGSSKAELAASGAELMAALADK